MTLTIFGWIYLFCFLLGLGYTLISLLLPHGHGHFDGTAVDATSIPDELANAVAHTQHPIGGHAAHPPEETGQPDFPLFSPLTIALSMTVFGGVGTILNILHFPLYVSAPASGVAGVIGWLGGFYVFFKFFRFSQSSSEAVVEQFVGKEAVVTLTVPEKGLGEISYVARGSQYNAPARSETGAPLRAGTHVVIVKVEESVCVVRVSIEERLNRLNEGKETV